VDNIKMDFREIGWDGVDWIDLPALFLEWLRHFQLLKEGSAP
jgi:hypothetical protein